MTVSVNKNNLTKLAETHGRSIWTYTSSGHILDIIAKSDYFSPIAGRFRVGDVIMVESPGFYDIQRFLGYPPTAVLRLGGGVLQVDVKSESGDLTIRIIGRGLSRFVIAGENAMSKVDTSAPAGGDALSA